MPATILALCGSLRAASMNAALLRATARLAPAGSTVESFRGIGELPLFNPDLEADLPAPARRLHAAISGCDALLIASPEYAHGVTAVIKNALDWLVSFPPFVDKPVAIFNASPRSVHAEAALRETLTTMSARIVPDACLALPLRSTGITEQGILDSEHAADIRRALTLLVSGSGARVKWIVILLVVIVAGAIGSYWYDNYSAESKLLEQPVYRVLKKHEPAVFDKLVEEYKVYARQETRRENFINLANSEINLVATRHLAHASQASVLALVKDMTATARRLQKEPGDVCFRYWFPLIAGPPDIAKYIDEAAQAHTLDLMGEVIRSASENPSPLPPADSDSVKDNLANVINATYAQYGSDAQMIAHADEARTDRVKVCAITISVYERILSLPPADSGALLRAMTQIR